ncbi:hypothetical protein PR048_016759 [Dryococelus australis]|uniref:Uncharacterized protein n=1 Tax=Dryococelus australis TaxID=614101 RepID=A0ABQ9H7L3_9NEOP|nr:hypothetical protein PR048_016759 [Dryococelus australis]
MQRMSKNVSFVVWVVFTTGKRDMPWQVVAIHLFKCDTWYVIVTDYYSGFCEICPLTHMLDIMVIGKLKKKSSHTLAYQK